MNFTSISTLSCPGVVLAMFFLQYFLKTFIKILQLLEKEELEEEEVNEEDYVLDPKIYKVSFIGGKSVGKGSLINQLMSSDHTNVYQNNDEEEEEDDDDNIEEKVNSKADSERQVAIAIKGFLNIVTFHYRELKVCVNNRKMTMMVREVSEV